MGWGSALAMLLWLGCGSDAKVGADDDDGSAGVGAGPAMVGAAGVGIREITFNQSASRVMSLDGAPQSSIVPLVAGRPGLLRVHYTVPSEQVGQPVTAELTIEGQDPIRIETTFETAQSLQQDLSSTINFEVPPEMVDGSFNYRIDLLQEGTEDNAAAHYPAEGFEAHAVEVPANTFRVKLVPFQYNADGSGRLPDLSAEVVEQFRQRFMQLYPVSAVEMSVREPIPWAGAIQPNGTGWQEVGMQLFNTRAADGLGDDVYYYAIFKPTATIAQFCGTGCLLGVTLLNDMPTDVGNPSLRIALGVGYPENQLDTSAHELAHAHGRGHAPCGPGLDPNSIDAEYPHGDGGIGVWGWDMFANQLVDPASHKDIMSYCDPQWISDHNFARLGARAKNVNLADWQAAGIDYQLVTIGGDAVVPPGAARTATSTAALNKAVARQLVPDSQLTGPPNTQLTLTTASGSKQVMGYTYHYDHLPGGWLLYPAQTEAVLSVDVTSGSNRWHAALTASDN